MSTRRKGILVLQLCLLLSIAGSEWTWSLSGGGYYYLRAVSRLLPSLVLLATGAVVGAVGFRADSHRSWLGAIGLCLFLIPLLGQLELTDDTQIIDIREFLLNVLQTLLCAAFGYWLAEDPRDMRWALRNFAVVFAVVSAYGALARFAGGGGEESPLVPGWPVRLYCLFAYSWFLYAWLTSKTRRGYALLGFLASCGDVLLTFHKPIVFGAAVCTLSLVAYCLLRSDARGRVALRSGILAIFLVPGFFLVDAMNYGRITTAMREEFRTKYLHADYRGDASTLGEAIDNASGGRFRLWEEGLQMAAAKPWFGTGYRPFASLAHGEEAYLHNVYLDLLVSFGLVGFLPVLVFILVWLWSVFRWRVIRNRVWDVAPCVAYCVAILAVNFVGSTRNFLTLNSFTVLLMTATAGAAAQVVSTRVQRRPKGRVALASCNGGGTLHRPMA